MAKWGEGDPRWIVEERADAKNVNNWHWTEKNATQWSIEKIKSLLVGYTIDTYDYFFEITNVSKCEGEAIANNRKAKLIFFYEWAIEAEWKGHKKKGDNQSKFRGKITVNNLSEEFACNELDFDVSCDSSSPDADDVKEFVRKDCAKPLREQLGMYITDLKHEYGKGLILPTKDGESDKCTTSNSTSSKSENIVEAMKKSRVSAASNDSQETTDLSVKETFMCTPEDLYRVFVTEELTKMFTRGDAIVQSTIGGKYEIFGGNVTGNFIELVPNKMISMSWRKGNWPQGHQSVVKLDFSPSEKGTRLVLTQTNVPLNDKESTRSGWKSHYFAPIQQTFGFGGRMF